MKVLVCHSQYRGGSVSGENRVVEDEVELLRSSGVVVALVRPVSFEPAGAWEQLKLGTNAVWSRRAVAEVRRAAVRFQPDVVHIHNTFPMLSPAVLHSVPTRVPIVQSLHNYRHVCLPGILFRDGEPCVDCLGRSPLPGIQHRCYKDSYMASTVVATSLSLHRTLQTWDRVRLFVAVSSYVRDIHVQAGIEPSRIRVKPNFCWPSARRRGPGSYFLYLGRLTEEKGLKYLIRAWESVSSELLIVGSGPLELHTSNPRVRVLGARTPQEVQKLITQARCVIIPSVWPETFGRGVIEAAAASVPSIVSDLGGLRETVVDGETGIRVAPGDAAALVGAVRRMEIDSFVIELGAGALDRWRRFYSPEVNVDQLIQLYQEASSVSSDTMS